MAILSFKLGKLFKIPSWLENDAGGVTKLKI
jgi:hypothetical protein